MLPLLGDAADPRAGFLFIFCFSLCLEMQLTADPRAGLGQVRLPGALSLHGLQGRHVRAEHLGSAGDG